MSTDHVVLISTDHIVLISTDRIVLISTDHVVVISTDHVTSISPAWAEHDNAMYETGAAAFAAAPVWSISLSC